MQEWQNNLKTAVRMTSMVMIETTSLWRLIANAGLGWTEVEMGTLFYRNYTITPGAIRDGGTGQYAPTVHITWCRADGKRDMRAFTLSERSPTFDEALTVAEEQAKAWANRWLTPSEPVANWKVALKTINSRIAKET